MDKNSSEKRLPRSSEEIIKLDNRTFQNHLVRIVGIPVFFILVLLVFFYFQNESVDRLRKQARNIDGAKLKLMQLDRKFSEIENSLRGFILSGDNSFKRRLKEKKAEVEPLSDQLFESLAGDITRNKMLRQILKDYSVFESHTTKSVKMRFEEGSQDSEQILLASLQSYRDLKAKTSDFYKSLEKSGERLTQKQIEISHNTSIMEVVFTLILAFIIIFILIKQLKSLTSNYRKLLQTNIENMEDLKASSKTKDLFLANMSHEIRTPLGAILGFSELLSDRTDFDSETMSHVSFIKRNSEHLLSLIDDLFDISRLTADKLDMNFEELKLKEFIEDIESYFQSKIVDKKIQLDVKLDTRIPESIETEPVRLKQIVTNLVGNAVKFSPVGSIVRLIFSYSNENLQVDVIDNGIGIDQSAQKFIFEAFNQANAEHSRNFGGAGLGLSISKKLAEALDGNLMLVSSQLKIGSHFRLTLPTKTISVNFLDRTFNDNPGLKPAPDPIRKKKSYDFSERKVLLAEDSKENQILFKIFIESSMANLEIVDNGSDAVRKALAEDFDVILMDIQMPGLDGYEAVNILRGSHYDKPIIALTAHAMKGEKEKCIKAGFTDYLSKPVSQQNLLKTLQVHF